MAEVINLRRLRKRKARDDKAQKGAENRAKFGRTKGEKQRESLTARRDSNSLDGAKIPAKD